jgi:deoxyinosine 3'endonuclease (endonuclease V)
LDVGGRDGSGLKHRSGEGLLRPAAVILTVPRIEIADEGWAGTPSDLAAAGFEGAEPLVDFGGQWP